MNEFIVSRWNSVVSNADTVYILGDLAMGKINESLSYVSQLNGTKILLPGNHDRCWFGGKKDHADWDQKYLDAGISKIISNSVDDGCGISNFDWHLDSPNGVIACHFPYVGDSHDEDRYSAYRPEDKGKYLIHGHVHDKWRVNGRMINVGVDVWDFYPVRLDTIQSIIDRNGAKCIYCGTEDCEYAPDSYDVEIHDFTLPTLICDECNNERYREV